MKNNEFNKIYNYAESVTIVNDSMLNCSGWFWINLTEKQHEKMYNLLLAQGAKEVINAAGSAQINLENGIGILKPN